MKKGHSIWTVSNLLSLSRFFLVIPILIMLAREQRAWAFLWMMTAVATDFLDGYFARRLNQRSDMGRILDPLADKIDVLAVGIFLIFSPLYYFPLWFLLFILIRELVLLLCSFSVVIRRQFVMESNRAGKNSAFATAVTVLLYAMHLESYGAIVIWIAFVLTLYSSYIYFRLFLKRVKQFHSEDKMMRI